VLSQELQRRCERNPRYSLRAFSQSLGLSHTIVSLVLSGKRPLSKKACVKVADALNYTPEETRALISNRVSQDLPMVPVAEATTLDLDSFAVISDWYHFAILSLLEVKGARFEPKWISRRLGISPVEARLAMERLKRLGLVHEVAGRWRQSSKSLKIASHLSTPATRKFQGQLIQKAAESLEKDPLGERDHTNITFAMDRRLVPYARERIRKFRRELCAELEAAGKAKDVYTICVQLFPLTEGEKK
jgi:uncharacterized protein (TIGR02147 family)